MTARHTQASLALIALGAMVALMGCGSGEGERGPPAGANRGTPVALELVDGRPAPGILAEQQVLHRDNSEEPQTLDPHLAEGVPSANILRDLFEGLTAESPEGRVVPGAAQRWNISRDGRTYTFYLRRDARWSNGDPLLAGDFVYALQRSANPETASKYAHILLPIDHAEAVLAGDAPVESLGVEALDDYTLQIRLVDPTPYFLGLLNHASTYPVHRPSIEVHGNRFSRPGNLVSNGAYTLVDWKVRSHIELARNPNYWDVDNVILERVFYYPLEDQMAAMNQFRAGDLHWTHDVPHNQFRWLQQNYTDQLQVSPWLGSNFFGFNLTREPFANSPQLRQALAMAIDRDLITEKVTQFGERPSFTLVPPGIGEYVSPPVDWSVWTQEERNEEAKRLLASAGYSAERPLRVQIRYNTGENNKRVALAVASMWKQVLGVEAELINEEWKVFLQNRSQKVLTEVFRAGWISDYADPYTFLEMFRTGHGQNDYGYSNRIFDSLLGQIAAERIPARRRRLMAEAERVLLEDWPIMPVYTYVTKRLVDPHLRGWEDNVMDHHYSKHMFLLRSAPDAPATPGPSPGEVVGTEDG